MSDALHYHKYPTPGKIGTALTREMKSTDELALAYSPGVADPVNAIADKPDLVYDYTAKGNLIAVVTNGSAILGLGNLGPLAAKPVMEGKAALFKKLANVDAFDIEINSKDPEQIIEVISAIAPTFGGINLEDIKAPECFEIETELQKRLDIPVFHDDQHGTAITVSAALINACKVQNKSIKNIKIVIQGAGASALAVGKLLLSLGLDKQQMIFIDSRGPINTSRTDLNIYKKEFAHNDSANDLYAAARGSDVFIDLAGATVGSPKKLIQSMHPDPILFTLSNPTPSIDRRVIEAASPNAIIATGLSNMPNQVNNVLCFPYIFRGALNARAKCITTKMKIAATYAIAKIAENDLEKNYILPEPNNKRLLKEVSLAVTQAYK